jgi:cyclopropane-fatty-acyl-phospholipid synthase
MSNSATAQVVNWIEQGFLPDAIVRAGIRRLLDRRLQEIAADDCERSAEAAERFIASMDRAPIAPLSYKANQQHYELPTEFFQSVLGRHLKYSCGYWRDETRNLDQAEWTALLRTADNAGIEDGHDILELGSGWGSLSLWLANHYRNARITAVSNSHSQRGYVAAEAKRRGLGNLTVVVADMNEFDPGAQFDRIVSVEMFEHMRNYRALYARIHDWLRPGGRFFKHIFVHRTVPYEFADRGPGDWMSRHFFSGGMMPSLDLPLRFQEQLRFVRRWQWSGTHYQKTANAWLQRLDANRDALLPLFERTYGAAGAEQWLQRWRIFFMACAELFGYRDGEEWQVAHYLFERPRSK